MAAYLAAAGQHEIALCVRQRFEELVVTTDTGVIASRPQQFCEPSTAPSVDWVLLATKAYATADAAAWLPRLTATGAPVAVLQNGIEQRERLAALVEPHRLLPAIIDLPAERTAPGLIRQRGQRLITVEDSALGRSFAALFQGTPLTVTLTSDFKSAAWRKLCLNAAGVINAILLQPARILHDEAVAEAAREIVRECVAVGRAEGAVLSDELPDQIVAGQRAAPPEAVNSLHADRRGGRPLELDARNGVIVRLGRKHGIPTPANQQAVALLAAMTAPGP